MKRGNRKKSPKRPSQRKQPKKKIARQAPLLFGFVVRVEGSFISPKLTAQALKLTTPGHASIVEGARAPTPTPEAHRANRELELTTFEGSGLITDSFAVPAYIDPLRVGAHWWLNRKIQTGLLSKLCEQQLLWIERDDVNDVTVATFSPTPAKVVFRVVPTEDEPTFRVIGSVRIDADEFPIEDAAAIVEGDLIAIGSRLAHAANGSHRNAIRSNPTRRESLNRDALIARIREETKRPDTPEYLLPDGVLPPPRRVAPTVSLRVARLGKWRMLPVFVRFVYDGEEVAPDDPRSSFWPDESDEQVERATGLEAAHIAELTELFPEYRPQSLQSPLPMEQLPGLARELLARGWEILADNRKVRLPGKRTFSVRSSGKDWFDLTANQSFDHHAVPIPTLMEALDNNEATVLLDDGSIGLLPEDWLRRQRFVLQLGKSKRGDVRYTQNQALLIDHLIGEDELNTRDEKFEAIRSRLRQATSIGPADPSATLLAELRAYQREGLGWLRYLRSVGCGGCLADDMGLGKTLQILAYLDGLRDQPRPFLVVAPLSLLHHWRAEAARFAPQLRVHTYHGPSRAEVLQSLEGGDLLLTTYGTLSRDPAPLHAIRFDCVILDESQAIKNHNTQVAKAVSALDTEHRIAVSGTPVENHIGELHSLFHFLNRGLLGAGAKFKQLVERSTHDGTTSQIASLLRPFVLRRTKQQVAPELPERIEISIECELEPEQRKLYDELRDYFRSNVVVGRSEADLAKNKMLVIEALLRLRQTACHPGLVDPTHNGLATGKFNALIPRLTELAESGQKALVFSQFTSYLALLRRELKKGGLRHEYLDGKTSDRAAVVDRFQSDDSIPLFLISLKAGGVGLNLTAASYVFLLDPWWNPAVEAQAIDRTHRIGQTKTVTAYRLIATDTIESKIAALQDQKRQLAASLFNDDNSILRELNLDELERLLS